MILIKNSFLVTRCVGHFTILDLTLAPSSRTSTSTRLGSRRSSSLMTIAFWRLSIGSSSRSYPRPPSKTRYRSMRVPSVSRGRIRRAFSRCVSMLLRSGKPALTFTLDGLSLPPGESASRGPRGMFQSHSKSQANTTATHRVPHFPAHAPRQRTLGLFRGRRATVTVCFCGGISRISDGTRVPRISVPGPFFVKSYQEQWNCTACLPYVERRPCRSWKMERESGG